MKRGGKKDQIEREVVLDVGLFNLWMVGLPEYIYKGENERVLNGRRVLPIINV